MRRLPLPLLALLVAPPAWAADVGVGYRYPYPVDNYSATWHGFFRAGGGPWTLELAVDYGPSSGGIPDLFETAIAVTGQDGESDYRPDFFVERWVVTALAGWNLGLPAPAEGWWGRPGLYAGWQALPWVEEYVAFYDPGAEGEVGTEQTGAGPRLGGPIAGLGLEVGRGRLWARMAYYHRIYPAEGSLSADLAFRL